MKLKDILNESVNQPINEKADPKNFIKGFVAGDVIVNDDNSRYVIVAQRGKQFIVGDNGERRESLPGGKVGKKNLKGNLSLKDILNESVNEAYDFKPNKNMNNLMKGRKIKNVVYSDKLGFAIILDNGKFVLIRGHRATPGSEKELELESVNEARVSIEAASVANLTGTRNLAVQDFIDAHNLDARKLYKHIKSGSLKDRMEFVTALAGKPGNPIQTKVIKMFGESVVNEGYSTEEKRIVMMAVRKLAKYRNVPINQSINDLLGAGQELERDIKKGKITK
jgi:hypothetical protein